jgi:hypothetical protein
VEEWRATAEWLNRLPICWAVRSSNDRGHPALGDGRFLWWDEYSPNGEFFVYDDEAEEARVSGPTCRRILNGWSAAFHPFQVEHRTTYIGLKDEEAKRNTLLAALTLDADIDAADHEHGWSWR